MIMLMVFVWLMVTDDVYGYLDPGTGSYIIQVILAALLGIGVAIKVYWKKIKVFLRNLFHKKTQQ